MRAAVACVSGRSLLRAASSAARDVGIDDPEVGDDQVLAGGLAVGEHPHAHVPHDVGVGLVAVPLPQQLDELLELLGVGAAHRDRLGEVPVHPTPPLRSATVLRCVSDIPSNEHSSAEPASSAAADFGGTPSDPADLVDRTASACSW